MTVRLSVQICVCLIVSVFARTNGQFIFCNDAFECNGSTYNSPGAVLRGYKSGINSILTNVENVFVTGAYGGQNININSFANEISINGAVFTL